MRFIWDENKNFANVTKHGLNFKDAERVFGLYMDTTIDDREDYGETRWLGIGLLDNRMVSVVYTEPDEDTIRIVSLRRATTQERKKYERSARNRLGAN